MNARTLNRRSLIVLAIAFWMTWAGNAGAREGFYLGGGFAQQSVSGDLDGTEAFMNPSGTVAILAGKPEPGSGFAFLIGYAFNPIVGIEYLYANTSHTASHDFIDIDSGMTLSTGLVGLRVTYQPQENLEIYGRVGLATATATYEKHALHGSVSGSTFVYSSTSEVEFSGSGTGFGAGIELFLGKVGLSANYTVSNISFDKADGGGVSGKLPDSLSTTISQVALIATYYFK